jgi:hypothetical protein
VADLHRPRRLSALVGVERFRVATRRRRLNEPFCLRRGVVMATSDVWTYRETTWTQSALTGFSVEAIDGSIGKVDDASNDVGESYIIVDTGPWIFGKKVMLPAGVISDVDLDSETVFVNRTKDEIKNAPEFDETRYRDDSYRGSLGTYYGPGGAGYRDYGV